MFHPNDIDSIYRMLGGEFDLAPVEAEYDMRQAMLHRDGQNGPLGAAILIDMLRALEYEPPMHKESVPILNWDAYPDDGSVRVLAKIGERWRPGKYTGFLGDGLLTVKLDDDPVTRECRRDLVQLIIPDTVSENEDGECLEVLPEPVVEPEPTLPEVLPPADDRDPDHVPQVDSEIEEFDWSAQPVGTKVWAEDNGDYMDGTLQGIGEDGTLYVTIDGEQEPQAFPRECVLFAGVSE